MKTVNLVSEKILEFKSPKATSASAKLKFAAILAGVISMMATANAQSGGHTMPHQMQHGFVLAAGDKFASHLVAPGHHSRQTEIIGQLTIDDQQELAIYNERKITSAGNFYFLFQAQNLDLPTLAAGQVLTGHIIESKIGAYESKNIIVKTAAFHVKKVLLNIPNPFFIEDGK